MKHWPALLIVLATQAGIAEPLGRLFHSAAERAEIDARAHGLRLDGRLQAANQPAREWLNGRFIDTAAAGMPQRVGDTLLPGAAMSEPLLPDSQITIHRRSYRK